MSDINLRVAAKAAIIYKNKVLILREANTYKDGTNIGKYGLVGGRINPEESFFDALERETKEETGLKVETIKPVYVGEWWPNIKGQKNHIVAVFVLCESKTDKVVLSEEHDSYEWVDAKLLSKFSMVEPDRTVAEQVLNDI
jgi:8-oxo-dGTP diphosphatase